MADNDAQWPSEDEDFDAVMSPDEIKQAIQNDNNSNDVSNQVEEPKDDSETKPNDSQQVNTGSSNTDVQSVSSNGQISDMLPAQDNETYASDNSDTESTQSSDNQVESNGYIDGQEQSYDDQSYNQDQQSYDQVNQNEYVESSQQPVKAKKIKKPRPPMPQFNPNHVMRFAIEALLVIIIVGLSLSLWTLKSDNNDLKQQVTQLSQNPEATVQKQTQQIISSVGALMQLPTGETPTIANVTNSTQAKQQSPFFNNAQNGDKVLMYVKSGKAILYRPSTDKIINVAPLTFTSGSSTASTGSTTTPTGTTKTTK